ncbi:MAG: Csp1 family four helix bundle copper storage protein [Bdellovibrionales bacterium]|nr:Csp1 family four helix bundle copper storage protein [Bdellovibrionales bacterium]
MEITRRDLIAGSAVLGAGLMFGGNVAFAASTSKLQRVKESTLKCIQTGNDCLAHCTAMLGKGDVSMKDCNERVQNMLAQCEAMQKVASLGTATEANLKALAKACAISCKDCADACTKHAKHHEVCKSCLEACKDCASACEAIA